MAFTNNYRMERVYFEKLKSMIDILKSFLNSETDQKARAMIENGIDADGAILLLYRNLGECWAEMSDLIKKANDRIDDLNDKSEAYHDELNERIDEVNNYLMALIRDLIARVESLESRMNAVEADLAQMGRVITYDLQRVNNAWTLTEGTQPVTFEQTAEYYNHERPHLVLVRGELNSEITYLLPREYDTTENTGLFEWYSFGFVGSEIHEITVTLLPDDSVNTAISTTDFAAILQRLSTAETNITDLQGRMTNAETDIDTLEQTAESHNDRITDLETCCDDVETALDGKQDTLVAGSGIAIDPTTNEISATGGDEYFEFSKITSGTTATFYNTEITVGGDAERYYASATKTNLTATPAIDRDYIGRYRLLLFASFSDNYTQWNTIPDGKYILYINGNINPAIQEVTQSTKQRYFGPLFFSETVILKAENGTITMYCNGGASGVSHYLTGHIQKKQKTVTGKTIRFFVDYNIGFLLIGMNGETLMNTSQDKDNFKNFLISKIRPSIYYENITKYEV